MAKKTTKKTTKRKTRKAPNTGVTETNEAPAALDAPAGAEGVPAPVRADDTPPAPVVIPAPQKLIDPPKPESPRVRVDIYRGARHDHLLVPESELDELWARVKKAKGNMTVGAVANVGDRVCATYRNGFHGEITAIEGDIATIKGPGRTICAPLAECAPSK